MKERLIGAAVLAALGVWLIPWLLDGPDEPLVNDGGTLELPVPSGHVGELRTEIIDLSSRRDEGAAGSTGVRSGPGSLEAERAASDARAAVSVPAPSSGGAGASSGDAPRGAASADTRASTSGSAADAGGPSETSGGAASSAGTPDSRSGTESTAGTPDGRTAASSDARAATSSNSAGSAAGAAGSTTPASAATSPASGPASSSASSTSTATATSARASSAEAPAARTEANATGDWAVQLGSFGDEANARRLADRVAALGHSPKISTYQAGGRVLYRVRVGPHATRAAAEAAASTLAARGLPTQVVTN